MALFDTNAFRISEQGLSVLWQKQQIIAENIANADTPDYNCKYLDFAGIFRDKLRSNGTVDTEIDLVQRLFIAPAWPAQPPPTTLTTTYSRASLQRLRYSTTR